MGFGQEVVRSRKPPTQVWRGPTNPRPNQITNLIHKFIKLRGAYTPRPVKVVTAVEGCYKVPPKVPTQLRNKEKITRLRP